MFTFPQRISFLATWWILFGTAIGQNRLCSVAVSNGTVTSSCSREPGSVCNFTCNSGFTPATGVNSVICGSDGNWTFTSAVCVVQCPVTVNRGVVTSCSRRPGDVCNFTCDAGLRPDHGVTSVLCGSDGQWVRKDVCIDSVVNCPNNFTGGSWVNCQYLEQDTCTYTCFSGFNRNPQIENATCGSDGAWNRNTEKLCRRKCDLVIPMGFLNSSCTLEIGETCTFGCMSGFEAAADVNTLTCQENGQWAPAEPCKEIICPSTIPNGTVSATACDRRPYSECVFTCNQGFDPNPKYNRIFCNMDGDWFESTEPFCLERKGHCINYFENGRWAQDCQFRSNEKCAFECANGFDRNPNITRNITCTSAAAWDIDLSLLCKEHDRGLIVTVIPGYSAQTKHIYTMPIAPDGTPNLNSMRYLRFPSGVQFLSIDGDYALHQTYVYDYYTKVIYRDSNFSIALSGSNTWTALHRGLSKDYVKLAVDWINHNIYWTDPQYKWIIVQSLLSNDTSMFRVLIHENLEGPHALALDPMEALLFWSDIGNSTKIEVSSLSGMNRKSIVSSNLIKPYSLAADYEDKRLYFIDNGRDTIESVTYEGKERKALLRKLYNSFFDIALHKDYLYVTDIYDYTLYFFNKTNGETIRERFYSVGEMFFGVTIFHPDAQPTSVTAHCINYGCEHICVTEKDGATCLCRDGYILNQDKKTCSVNDEYFHRGLVFSNKSSICIVDIRILTHFSFYPRCVLKTNGTKYMVLDTDQRQIIIANDTSIYFAKIDNLELHQLTEPYGFVSGLAWDGYDRNVYWSNKDTGIIWRLSKNSNIAEIFLRGLKNPRDILLLQHERLLFWISDRNGSTIESSNLFGSDHQVVLNTDDLLDTKSLCYDPYNKRIYFVNVSPTGLNYVYSCKLDGSDLNDFVVVNRTLEKLEIYKGHLLVTSKDPIGTLIMSYSIDSQTKTTSGVFPGAGNISTIKVFDETVRQNETGPCFNLNGECEQICISNGKSRTCECSFGFSLGPNGKSCISEPVKDNFMLIVDMTHNEIYQASLDDQSIHGINAKGTKYMTGVTYSPVHDLVIWGTQESELSIIYLNGTGEKMFPVSISDDSYHYPNRFAVDYSTGNIYYTAVNYLEYFMKFKSYIGVQLPNGKHRVLVTGLSYPQGIVLYPSKGLLFYTDNGHTTHLGQANMDGSQWAVFLDSGRNEWPSELTIDYKRDYLYWIDSWDDSIRYCRLDGTNVSKLVQYHEAILNGLAFYQDYLYISASEYSHMRKVKISDPNITMEFATQGLFGTIQSVSIYSSTAQNKNAFCSVSNGGCSTFCFPTPSGGICGCEDGVNLKERSDKICSNIPQCLEIQNQTIVSSDCQRVNGSKCTFTCKQGYKARQGVNNVLCNGSMYSPTDACEEMKCPSTLVNGKWVNCNFTLGKTCKYTCDKGYTMKDAVTDVECQITGNWKLVNTDSPCTRITCPDKFNQGSISSTCTNIIGQRCDYQCTGYGYMKNENISTIVCMESGTWNTDTGILCQQILCPKEIPNGVLLKGSDGQVCTRTVGSRCYFECKSGFVNERKISSLHCLPEGWSANIQTLCTEPQTASSASQVNQAAVGVGVGVGVSVSFVVIIIVSVILFFILRRRSQKLSFAPKRMVEEETSEPDMAMNTSFGHETDSGYSQVTFENGVVHLNVEDKRDEPAKQNTRRDDSVKYDNAMAIPRPRAKENVYNKMS
ncbi:hypothetical protein CHS0354_026072 [Potamilus streckersoni]|uniref:Sushi domain-containing protein n=1 Tax=Potamilus streckersoni TaxID=2493646 RepID=A0AAE0VUE5_9BIVA|nr:hypothetical protein CHS0354_026072 [Potamilus streckersoni]